MLEREILIVEKVVENVGRTGMRRKGKINKSYKRGICSGCTSDVPNEQSRCIENY